MILNNASFQATTKVSSFRTIAYIAVVDSVIVIYLTVVDILAEFVVRVISLSVDDAWFELVDGI